MSRLRGDDDLSSLMMEMASAQGYMELEGANDGTNTTAPASKPTAHLVRLASNVEGYPSDKPAGSNMIWNPYIQVSAKTNAAKCVFPPTNPHVEVLRRRAYESFKGEFRASLERISVNATAKVGPSNLWSELSPVSMMERWHFDAKLYEFLHADATERRMIVDHVDSYVTTAKVKAVMDLGMVDPILISTNMRGRRKQKWGEKSTSVTTDFRSATSLLSEEVKFEWTRTWKRIAGERYQDTDLKQIFESKRFQKKLSRLCRSVMEAAAKVEASFYDQVSKRAALEAQLAGRPSKKSSVPKIIMEADDAFVKFSGLSFRINQEHYRKLQVIFDRMHPYSIDLASHESAFSCCLFCLLCRYDMLQGAGLQSSMHGSVFDVLLQAYDCRLECFASPLNSRYERYCSAFFDTDGPFGSVGSFFDYDFTNGGCYQANPPFVLNFIKCMYDTMNAALQTCQQPLMFVVFVPAWKETSGWNLLHDSHFLTKEAAVSQSSHYYCEGTQHRRKDRYRVASFDTSVFILQNEGAVAKWSISESQMDDIKKAFQLDPNRAEEKNVAADDGREGGIHEKHEDGATERKEPINDDTLQIKTKKPKKKRKRKQKALSEAEEGSQQLGILNSLGLSDHSEAAGSRKKLK